MPDPVYVGVDIETTGLDVLRHKAIQVGIAWWHDNTPASGMITAFTQEVGWLEFEYDPAALKVNGRTPEDIYNGPAHPIADTKLFNMAEHHFPRTPLIPVGWNPGIFDVVFLQQQLPLIASKLGYRSVDMNTLAFHMAVAFNASPEEFRAEAREYSKDALANMGFAENWHDAGYDAAAALTSWEYFKHAFTKGRVMPSTIKDRRDLG